MTQGTVVCGLLALTTAVGWPQQLRDPAGTYRLVRIGNHTPDYYADSGYCDVPRFSEYRLKAARWFSTDTVRLNDSCKAQTVPEYHLTVRADSGHYRLAGDTVHFYVADTRIGLNGWVDRGFLHGDTLRFVAGEFDPGDYVYLRRKDANP
jgi:hypothetical protein